MWFLVNFLVFPLLFLHTFSLGVEMNDIYNCTILRENFGISVSQFTLCAISNSHPIKLCESCIDQYINVGESYTNLSKFKDDKDFCISHYINLDRLGIVSNMYENVYNLWNNAKCYECYEVINSVLTHNLSQETIEFLKLYNRTQKCIGKYPKTMCDFCMDPYLKLNNYYYSISNENDKIGMCMDIVDLMNTTRTEWSEKCCKYRKHSEYAFIGSSVGIMIVTILFYVLTKVFIDKKSTKIVTQHRFVESLSSSNRRDNN
nr:uncharacterized protein LOC111415691 [Onthophagus taurus]